MDSFHCLNSRIPDIKDGMTPLPRLLALCCTNGDKSRVVGINEPGHCSWPRRLGRLEHPPGENVQVGG